MTVKLNFTDGVPLHEDSDGNVRVIGSRVTLHTIVGRFNVGDTIEEIHEGFPSVTIAQIKLIIDWYLNHRAEVDEYIREVDEEGERLRLEFESRPENIAFREKLRSRREQLIKN
jgi:uncharacterized protein (DUF433 family)